MNAQPLSPILNVRDLEGSFAWFEKIGSSPDWAVIQRPADGPWNARELHVRHPDGHTLRIGAQMEQS